LRFCISTFLFTVYFKQRLPVHISTALLHCYTDSLMSHSNMFRPLICHIQVHHYTVLFAQAAAVLCLLTELSHGRTPTLEGIKGNQCGEEKLHNSTYTMDGNRTRHLAFARLTRILNCAVDRCKLINYFLAALIGFHTWADTTVSLST
jgi:hypothetical protein